MRFCCIKATTRKLPSPKRRKLAKTWWVLREAEISHSISDDNDLHGLAVSIEVDDSQFDSYFYAHIQNHMHTWAGEYVIMFIEASFIIAQTTINSEVSCHDKPILLSKKVGTLSENE